MSKTRWQPWNCRHRTAATRDAGMRPSVLMMKMPASLESDDDQRGNDAEGRIGDELRLRNNFLDKIPRGTSWVSMLVGHVTVTC